MGDWWTLLWNRQRMGTWGARGAGGQGWGNKQAGERNRRWRISHRSVQTQAWGPLRSRTCTLSSTSVPFLRWGACHARRNKSTQATNYLTSLSDKLIIKTNKLNGNLESENLGGWLRFWLNGFKWPDVVVLCRQNFYLMRAKKKAD